jgi:hypothetical protein
MEAAFDALLLGTHGRLTEAERRTVAIVAAEPFALLTLDSASMTRDVAVSAFRRLVQRLNYWLHLGHPLVYYAVPACSSAGLGWHIHAIVWDFLLKAVLNDHAHEVGFGLPYIKRIDRPEEKLRGTLAAVSYVTGQAEPVFGLRVHERHVPRPAAKRGYLLPQGRTIEQSRPELLSMLDRAKDKAVTDDALLRSLPLFSNEYGYL